MHALTLFGLLLAGSGSVVEGAANAVPSALVAEAPVPAGREVRFEPGVKVPVDPVTGELITEPTEADLEILAQGARRIRRPSSFNLQSFKLARGGEGVFLDGWADHALAVRIDAEGNLVMTCSRGDEHGGDVAPAVALSTDEGNQR